MDRSRPAAPRSVKRRLRRWTTLAFAVTILTLTAAAVVEERRLVVNVARANGESLVAHLAAMPEFRTTAAEARRHAAHLDEALRGAGIRLEVVPTRTPAPGVLASRDISLAEGPFVLRYRVDAPWLSGLLERALVVHLLFGGVALAILLAGSELILRTGIFEPLRRMAHQIRFMRKGGGWRPRLPPCGAELADLGRALEELGPALQRQFEEWLEGERRAAAAQALSRVRERLREPQRHALALMGDLQAKEMVAPEAKRTLRALVADVERLTREISLVENERFSVSAGRDPHAGCAVK